MRRPSETGAARRAAEHPKASHFDFVKIEVRRPSETHSEAENRQIRGKTTANTPVSAETGVKRPQTPLFPAKNRSGADRTRRASHFDFPIHPK